MASRATVQVEARLKDHLWILMDVRSFLQPFHLSWQCFPLVAALEKWSCFPFQFYLSISYMAGSLLASGLSELCAF